MNKGMEQKDLDLRKEVEPYVKASCSSFVFGGILGIKLTTCACQAGTIPLISVPGPLKLFVRVP